jgi:hypothetical protein
MHGHVFSIVIISMILHKNMVRWSPYMNNFVDVLVMHASQGAHQLLINKKCNSENFRNSANSLYRYTLATLALLH